MLKRISSFTSALVISLSSLFVFAPALVNAAADTCTWTGGGGDDNFSTAANWSGCDNGTVPENGDTLAFPALATRQTPYNDTTFTYAGISFTGIPGTCGAATDWYTVTGSQTLNVGGNLTDDMTGSACNSAILALNVTISGNGTVGGDGILEFGANNSTTLGLGTSDITIARTLIINSVLSGGSASSITVASDTGLVLNAANPAFDGQLIVNDLLSTVAGGLGSATGNTVINDGGAVCYAHDNQSTTVTEPFVFNAGTWDNYAVFYTDETCYQAGGGGSVSHTDDITTLSGAITIAEDTVFETLGTIKITGSVTGNFDFSVPNGSYGILEVGNEQIEAPEREVTVASGDESSTYVSIGNKETYIINGTRGGVSVTDNGVLKGSGTVEDVYIYDGGTIAPGQSPGCLNTSSLTLVAGAIYDFEVGGATECTEYDQIKVTGTVDLGDGTLNTILYNDFKPVKDQVYKIIDNDAADAVTGTFLNLAEGATFDGYVLKVSYVGGDGNDVTLTVQSVPTVPNTGFKLMLNNPILTLASTTVLAGAMLVLAKKYKQVTNR